MPAPVIAAGIGGVSSIVGSLLSGRPKTQTQTSTSMPTFSPQMQSLMDRMGEFYTSSMQNPEASFGPVRAAGLDRINRTYDVLPQAVMQQASRRGYGSAGSTGNSLYKVGMARAGDISNFEGNLAQEAIQRQMAGASGAANLLQLNRGTTTTGTATTPDTSMSNAFMSGGNAMSNLATLMMLNNVFQSQPTPTNYGGYGATPSGGFNYSPYSPGGVPTAGDLMNTRDDTWG